MLGIRVCLLRSLAIRQPCELGIRWASRSAKKGESQPEPITFGKVGHSLKCGVVGVPNVGKSSFFNLLTNGSAQAENYPFCTIDPNEGRVAVPDSRFDKLCEMFNPKKCTPAYMLVTDIAGLVKGASEGKGLGNSFLSHIGAVDGIFHLCRGFDTLDVAHVEGSIDPVRDLEIIAQELRLKDLSYLEARAPAHKSKGKKDAAGKIEYDALCKARDFLARGDGDIRNGVWTQSEVEVLNPHFLLTAKPAIYVLNVCKDQYLSGSYKYKSDVEDYVRMVEKDDLVGVIPFSADYEREVQDGVEELLKESAIPAVVHAGFRSLGLASFFTIGEDEVRSWPVHCSTKAPAAAGRIHTDFEKTFIQAEIMLFDDLVQLGGEDAVKTAGKVKRVGKDYRISDGDIVHFRVGARRK